MTVGRFLKVHLKDHRLTIAEAAARCDVHKCTLNQIVNDNLDMTLTMALKIEKGLGIDATRLCTLEIDRRRNKHTRFVSQAHVAL